MTDAERDGILRQYIGPVIFGIVSALAGYGVAAIIWGTRIDGRLGVVEKKLVDMETIFARYEADSRRLIIIEERQNRVIDNVKIVVDGINSNAGRLDKVIQELQRHEEATRKALAFPDSVKFPPAEK